MAKGKGPVRQRIGALVLIALLVAPRGLAHRTAPALQPECVTTGSRLLAVARSALVSVDSATGARVSLSVQHPRRVVPLAAFGLALVQDSHDRWALVPVTGGVALPVPGPIAATLLVGRALTLPATRWIVERLPSTDAVNIRIVDRARDDTAYSVSFPRRIELAASASSADGRFFVHIQANNVASEVVIVDALARRQRTVTLPHDARVAAFAISLTFSPDTSCVAISMERADVPAPESWFVGLLTDSATIEPVDWGYVVAWPPAAK